MPATTGNADRRTIQTEKDVEGLHTALRELFEESYLADATGGAMVHADAETRQSILDDLPPRTLSPGYYSRAAYLLDLASAIERGAVYGAHTLTRDDVRGLEALKRAKCGFEREHFPCPACGTRQDNQYVRECRSCKAKFGGKG